MILKKGYLPIFGSRSYDRLCYMREQFLGNLAYTLAVVLAVMFALGTLFGIIVLARAENWWGLLALSPLPIFGFAVAWTILQGYEQFPKGRGP